MALLAVDGEGRVGTSKRAGEGVHRGEWIELPEIAIENDADGAVEALLEERFGLARDDVEVRHRGTFVGRGDAFSASVEIHEVRGVPHAGRGLDFVTREALREAWRRGEALLSPSLATYVALGDEAPLDRDGAYEIAEGFFMIPVRTPTILPATHTNAFLVAGDEAVIIEPASADHAELERFVSIVEAERARLGFQLREILVTHHHPDHVGGARYLSEHFGVPLRAHRATIARLEGSVDFHGAIDEGERIALGRGIELEAMHTPGHAPGHLCFFEHRTRALVAGDMVAGIGTILVEKHDGDMSLYLESLERMKERAPSMLLPAHGGVILSPKELLDFYRAHRLMREAKVLEALLRKREATVEELLPLAYDDTPQAVWPLAALSLEAHLLKLEKDGRAACDDEVWRAV